MEFDYAGKYLRHYRPPIISLNSLINSVYYKPIRHKPAAIITREVQFPDGSFYQKEIDFEVLRQYTKAFIFRAGQNLWVDDQFERNYAEAERTGLYKGVYWFYDGRVSPGAQADILITLLRNKTLEMEIFIDWEKNYGGSHEGLQNVVAMMQRVEAAGLRVKDVGMYTGYYFFRSNSNPISHTNQYNYLKNKPLWEAWYTSNPSLVLIPAPWTYLAHWQFGTPVVAWGQQTSEFDMNFHNGSAQNFHNRYGGLIPPTEGGTMTQGTVKSNATKGLNVRNASGSVVAALRYDTNLQKGDVVYGELKPDKRIYFSKIYRANGIIQDLGGIHSSITEDAYGVYMDFANVPEPGTEPPPPPPPPPPSITLPDHLIAYDSANNPIGRYNLQ